MNPGHQPQRFLIYTELPDGTGFTIKECSHVFLFDRYGGWYDEYENYYNQNGDPEDPPSSSQSYSHSEKYSQSSSVSDQFEREFGLPQDLSDEEYEPKIQETQAIAQNLFHLQNYPQSQPLRVYFRNLPYKSRKEEVLKTYNNQLDNGILNAILDKDENGKNIGTGYFIVKPNIAERIAKLEGHRLLERPLHFQIQDYENFLVFPVTEKELEEKPAEKTQKYVPKSLPKEEEVTKPLDVQVRWRWYKFEKDLFSKKTQFFAWMIENGFNREQDFKNIQKMENNTEKKYVKIQMTETAYNSINGHLFGQRAVQFTPL